MGELDVLIVGAGLSGIAAAWHLQAKCPDRSFALLEARDAIGGTWDLFRYPGIRSDSDMFTLGYGFRPWISERAIAPGPAIREYVRETARVHGIDRHIRFGHRVTAAAWNTQEARWTVTVATAAGEQQLRCRFLFFCSGYYDYAQGHAPAFPGQEAFGGTIVHPQHWPEDLDYAGKRVVVIGSGATAVTLVPEMAARTAHITMLQRSPSWVVALPARDRLGAAVQRVLPRRAAHTLIRWKNILIAMALFQFARRRPQSFQRLLLGDARRRLPQGFDVERHLLPRYAPWDQRLCIIPDADLYKAIASGKASIVTDTIERFTAGGIRLASGAELPADIIVSATGLKLQMLGGARLTVDGEPVDLAQRVAYRGAMCEGVPNLALAMGYTNASWTLKAELIARYVCRLLNHMRAHGEDFCVPVRSEGGEATRPALDLNSGYIQRAAGVLPRQGERKPWRMLQNYLQDIVSLRFSRLRDGALRFGRAVGPRSDPTNHAGTRFVQQ
ncbi:NAD(P)/FAD-dependent oxidoreductase [Ramlibacter sp. XY19]|uniref:flavin-containing monooxygenase n=1 Tax=Ramlibacter paludis TaxID=2908000 RepID=UPI0023D9BFD2|nr:NAD(P)/FAD-dependent oxidoreductase [Ramlibacter paludis]MCG2595733.1 NAD(P)/FAD-dependent oxidoreductase [Ramlibacter paludis]